MPAPRKAAVISALTLALLASREKDDKMGFCIGWLVAIWLTLWLPLWVLCSSSNFTTGAPKVFTPVSTLSAKQNHTIEKARKNVHTFVPFAGNVVVSEIHVPNLNLTTTKRTPHPRAVRPFHKDPLREVLDAACCRHLTQPQSHLPSKQRALDA